MSSNPADAEIRLEQVPLRRCWSITPALQVAAVFAGVGLLGFSVHRTSAEAMFLLTAVSILVAGAAHLLNQRTHLGTLELTEGELLFDGVPLVEVARVVGVKRTNDGVHILVRRRRTIELRIPPDDAAQLARAIAESPAQSFELPRPWIWAPVAAGIGLGLAVFDGWLATAGVVLFWLGAFAGIFFRSGRLLRLDETGITLPSARFIAYEDLASATHTAGDATSLFGKRRLSYLTLVLANGARIALPTATPRYATDDPGPRIAEQLGRRLRHA